MPASKPPVGLNDCHIEQYAVCGRSMTFTGHRLLFSDSKQVGPAPRLALGRDRHGDLVLLHCDVRWNVLGMGAYPNVRAAKRRAERFYPGVSRLWRRTGYTRARTNRHLERTGGNRKCAICGRPWWTVEQIVTMPKSKLAICDGCIRQLYALISATDEGDDVRHPSKGPSL